jgi:hypothetical protein
VKLVAVEDESSAPGPVRSGGFAGLGVILLVVAGITYSRLRGDSSYEDPAAPHPLILVVILVVVLVLAGACLAFSVGFLIRDHVIHRRK